MVFSIFFPVKDENAETMRINGNLEELGEWNKRKPIDMELGEPRKWLTGAIGQPWEQEFWFPLHYVHPDTRVKYKYTIWNSKTNSAIWEREPTRQLYYRDPSEYNTDCWKEEFDER